MLKYKYRCALRSLEELKRLRLNRMALQDYGVNIEFNEDVFICNIANIFASENDNAYYDIEKWLHKSDLLAEVFVAQLTKKYIDVEDVVNEMASAMQKIEEQYQSKMCTTMDTIAARIIQDNIKLYHKYYNQ
jgi:hypothetical protein